MAEQRDNSGALFKNDKGDNDKRPDYRGDCLIDGTKYEIAAWIKDGRKGKFMSLSFKVAEERQKQHDQHPLPERHVDYYDDPNAPF